MARVVRCDICDDVVEDGEYLTLAIRDGEVIGQRELHVCKSTDPSAGCMSRLNLGIKHARKLAAKAKEKRARGS
jgi:hypothetical protein